MAEFQPVIAEEYEFENWVKLTKVAQIDTDARSTNWPLSQRKNLYVWIVSDVHHDGRDKACSFDEIWNWISIDGNPVCILWIFWTVTNLLHGSKQNKLSNESSSANQKFMLETFVGWIIHVVSEKFEFSYRYRTMMSNVFFWFAVRLDFDRGIKTSVFTSAILNVFKGSDWDLDKIHQAYSCTEICVQISRKFINNSTSHKFLTITILQKMDTPLIKLITRNRKHPHQTYITNHISHFCRKVSFKSK